MPMTSTQKAGANGPSSSRRAASMWTREDVSSPVMNPPKTKSSSVRKRCRPSPAARAHTRSVGDEVDKGRGRREPRDEEQHPEHGAVPERPRTERAEEHPRVHAEQRAEQHVGHADVLDQHRAPVEPGGPAVKQRDLALEALGDADERVEPERRVDHQEDPRAPRHGRRHLERRVEAPDVQLVLEVEEERPHAAAEQHEADVRQVETGEDVLLVLALQHEVARDDHDAGDQPAEEQVDRDLPAPDVHQRVDQLVVARDGEFLHRATHVR